MNRYLIIIFVAVTSVTTAQRTYSQTPYQTLDSLTRVLENLQVRAQGLTYKDATGKKNTLAFPVNNFNVFSYNRLATKVVIKKWENNEVLALTQNIDLTKATELITGRSKSEGDYIALKFPTDYLKTELYKNGVLQETVSENYLEFFYNTNVQGASRRCYHTLNKLVNLLKGEKKPEFNWGLDPEDPSSTYDFSNYSMAQFASLLNRRVLEAYLHNKNNTEYYFKTLGDTVANRSSFKFVSVNNTLYVRMSLPQQGGNIFEQVRFKPDFDGRAGSNLNTIGKEAYLQFFCSRTVEGVTYSGLTVWMIIDEWPYMRAIIKRIMDE